MRKRLRERVWSYDTPYDHTRWDDHRERVKWTIRELVLFTNRVWGSDTEISAADLTCGDAAVMRGLVRERVGHVHTTIGDIVYNPNLACDVVGPIEETIIKTVPPQGWDLFICTETLEHLDMPDVVLKMLRGRTRSLLVTTPIGEWDDGNWEHVWGWDVDGVDEMLNSAGFIVAKFATMNAGHYTHGLWGCR